MNTETTNVIFKIIVFIVIAIVLFKLFTGDEHFDDPLNNPNIPYDYFICNPNDPKNCSLPKINGKEWKDQDPAKKPAFLLCNDERCRTFDIRVAGSINLREIPDISRVYVNKHFNSVPISPIPTSNVDIPSSAYTSWQPGDNIKVESWQPGDNIKVEHGKIVQNNVAHCAIEGGTCHGTGVERYVVFGADNRYVNKKLNGDVHCSGETFGVDPAPGVVKACYNTYLPRM